MICLVFAPAGRGDRIQAERLSGLHPLSAAERRHSGPGRKGQDHPGGPTRMPGPLQQLRLALSEPGCVRGERERLLLRLRPVSLHRVFLSRRYRSLNSHTPTQTLQLMFLCVLHSKKANKHVQMEIKGHIDVIFWVLLVLPGFSKKKKKVYSAQQSSTLTMQDRTPSTQIQLHSTDLNNGQKKPKKK